MGRWPRTLRARRYLAGYFVWLAAIIVGYAVLTTVVQQFHIRRFGGQRV